MSLVEVGFKYHLIENLKNCKKIRQKYIDNIYNIGLFIFLFGSLLIFLFVKYKGKLTEEEIFRRNKVKEQYVLTRIKNYQDDRRKNSQNLITGLPHWSNEYDDIYKKKYVNNIII